MLTSFADKFPSYLEKPFEAGTVDKIFGNLPSFARDALGGFLGNIADYVSSFSTGFFGIASAAAGGAVSFILVIVLFFYLSMQENGVENFLKIVIPARHENYAVGLWQRWKKKIGLWLQGQILLGVIVGGFLYIIIQQFENHLIYPLVVRKIVGVPSIMVILALVIGAQIGGFFGLLLAIPMAAVVIEVLDDLNYRKKQAVKET